MPLDNNIVEKTERIFQQIFGSELKLIDKTVDDTHMGFFALKYSYLVEEYYILFENCEGVFDIFIIDAEGAKSSLYRLKKYEAYLTEKNINDAINLLHKTLEEKNFDLLYEKDGEMYSKKMDGTIRRL